LKYQHRRNNVLRCLAFIEAHQRAETKLKTLLSTTGTSEDPLETAKPSSVSALRDVDEDVEHNDDAEKTSSSRGSFDEAIAIVLKESKQQVKKAKSVLSDIPNPEIQRITSHYVCTILLHRLIGYVQQNIKDGLISKKEGMLYLKQIDRNLHQSYTCTHSHSNESDIQELLRQNSNPRLSERSSNGVKKPPVVADPSERVTAVMEAYLYKR
jgi:hypothetical protein